MTVVHETVRVSQTVAAPLDVTWRAFAETSLRARWSVPGGEQLVYVADDFRPTGRARYRCGTPGVLEYRGELEYVQVVAQERVVHTETVWAGDDLLSTALLTWSFGTCGTATTVAVVDQMTSFAGQDLIEGHRAGHASALARLDQLLWS